MADDIRWKQRFENFEKAYGHFKEIFLDAPENELTDIIKTAGVQRFEFTFELAWKVMKDYLQYTGIKFDMINPRAVIKEAFASKLVDNGQDWIDMMETRNKLSHTYNENNFLAAFGEIKIRYAPIIQKFLERMREQHAIRS